MPVAEGAEMYNADAPPVLARGYRYCQADLDVARGERLKNVRHDEAGRDALAELYSGLDLTDFGSNNVAEAIRPISKKNSQRADARENHLLKHGSSTTNSASSRGPSTATCGITGQAFRTRNWLDSLARRTRKRGLPSVRYGTQGHGLSATVSGRPPCSRPTTARVIEIFEPIQRHLLIVGDSAFLKMRRSSVGPLAQNECNSVLSSCLTEQADEIIEALVWDAFDVEKEFYRMLGQERTFVEVNFLLTNGEGLKFDVERGRYLGMAVRPIHPRGH